MGMPEVDGLKVDQARVKTIPSEITASSSETSGFAAGAFPRKQYSVDQMGLRYELSPEMNVRTLGNLPRMIASYVWDFAPYLFKNPPPSMTPSLKEYPLPPKHVWEWDSARKLYRPWDTRSHTWQPYTTFWRRKMRSYHRAMRSK